MKSTDVAVVGAGPAGIAAALAAATVGAKTTLIDEQPRPGGHLRWTIDALSGLTGDFAKFNGAPGVRLGEELSSRLAKSGVEFVTRGTAWGWFAENILGVVANGASYELEARSIVVATGSTDIMSPFPGSTLPGVMTARAVMIFLHLHRVLPGRRFAVIGPGTDAIEVSNAIEAAGAEVVCRVKEVVGLRVTGEREVRETQLPDRSFDVDAVAVALGRQPDPELALQALARNAYSAGAGGIVPRRGPRCETSTPGLYVAGDAGGIVTVAEALAEGHLAGLAAAGAGDNATTAAQQELASLRDDARSAVVDQLRIETAVL